MPCETVYAFACQIGRGAAWQQWRNRQRSMSQCRQIGHWSTQPPAEAGNERQISGANSCDANSEPTRHEPNRRARLFQQYKFKAPNARRIPKESRFYFTKSQRQSTSDGRFAAKVSNPYRIEATHMQAQPDP
ncbi:MAG TPA: hypothetical protein IAC59_04515 [Candidatus Fimadaptatus faecigallinarum]|uniref:Uncharacterized protein n=1 Tax=Candidatus Fimadaptatus faecigallinarum TaxID=2840814 RepID=A0A9D1LR84_9FIRM|nr:hypothetical protein [Candidatus Fimadaptatus faecigallinarum]